MECLSRRRGELALIGKRYHSDVDAAQRARFAYQNFPLIVNDGWVLDRPIPLSEATNAKLPKLSFAPQIDPRPLAGLSATFMTLKSKTLNHRNPALPQYDGDCYRVLDITPTARGLDIEFGPGKYFDYVNSCEVLGVELADWRLVHPTEQAPQALPLRGRPDAIFDFKARSACAGVNCLTLLMDYPKVGGRSTGNYFLVHERGEATLEAQNTVHVIPAGGHQPLKTGFGDDREVQIWRTAVREFVEELFSKEELALQKREPDDFLDRDGVREIVDALFRGARGAKPSAHVYLLGVGLDPVTTKPEVLIAIVANWRKALAGGVSRLNFNWEGQGDWVELSAENLQREARGNIRTSSAGVRLPTLPAGAACMQIAARHLDFLISEAP